jgi:hypothetical protein
MVRLLAAVLLAPALAAGIAVGAVRVAGHPPAYAGPEPEGLVWAGRVFTGRPPLAVWLQHRNGSYGTWSARHPRAAARLEHRRGNLGS